MIETKSDAEIIAELQEKQRQLEEREFARRSKGGKKRWEKMKETGQHLTQIQKMVEGKRRKRAERMNRQSEDKT